MSYLEVRGLEKSFVTARGTTRVLGGLDLTLEQGEFVPPTEEVAPVDVETPSEAAGG